MKEEEKKVRRNEKGRVKEEGKEGRREGRKDSSVKKRKERKRRLECYH